MTEKVDASCTGGTEKHEARVVVEQLTSSSSEQQTQATLSASDRQGGTTDASSDVSNIAADQRMMRAAVEYAERGCPVFPCNPKDKKPLTKHGFKDATTDAAVNTTISSCSRPGGER
jgi:hypothetical protein